VTVEVPGWGGPELVAALRARRIHASAALREFAVIDMDEKRASSILRLSPHYYNTEAELDAAVAALGELALARAK